MPAASPLPADFRAGMRRFAGTNRVHGECGGYMVLGAGLEDAEGARHEMLGLLGHTPPASPAAGCISAIGRRACWPGRRSGPQGTVIRGHEFHYAVTTDRGADPPLAEHGGRRRTARLARQGGRRGQVTGSFFHAIAPA